MAVRDSPREFLPWACWLWQWKSDLSQVSLKQVMEGEWEESPLGGSSHLGKNVKCLVTLVDLGVSLCWARSFWQDSPSCPKDGLCGFNHSTNGSWTCVYSILLELREFLILCNLPVFETWSPWCGQTLFFCWGDIHQSLPGHPTLLLTTLLTCPFLSVASTTWLRYHSGAGGGVPGQLQELPKWALSFLLFPPLSVWSVCFFWSLFEKVTCECHFSA